MKKKLSVVTTTEKLDRELKENSLVHTILYTLLLCLLASLLCFCYFSVFTSYFYPKNFRGHYVVGVVDVSTFDNVKKGQLLEVQKYQSVSEIDIGDEIFFAGNSGDGSGKVTGVSASTSSGYIVVDCNGTSRTIAISTIIGQIVNKIDSWGYVVWFFSSYVGVVVLTLTLVMVVVIHTIVAYYTETSRKGKALNTKLRKQKKAYGVIRRMYKNYKNTGLDKDTFEILSGDFVTNKNKLMEYAKANDLPNAYKFLLTKVHRTYITKQKLSYLDKEKITNIVELMCLCENFDIDIEYMLTDLILHTKMIAFDADNFCKECLNYLSEEHSTDDLACWESLLYVLLKQNKDLRKHNIIDVCNKLEQCLSAREDDLNTVHLLNLSNYIKNLV